MHSTLTKEIANSGPTSLTTPSGEEQMQKRRAYALQLSTTRDGSSRKLPKPTRKHLSNRMNEKMTEKASTTALTPSLRQRSQKSSQTTSCGGFQTRTQRQRDTCTNQSNNWKNRNKRSSPTSNGQTRVRLLKCRTVRQTRNESSRKEKRGLSFTRGAPGVKMYPGKTQRTTVRGRARRSTSKYHPCRDDNAKGQEDEGKVLAHQERMCEASKGSIEKVRRKGQNGCSAETHKTIHQLTTYCIPFLYNDHPAGVVFPTGKYQFDPHPAADYKEAAKIHRRDSSYFNPATHSLRMRLNADPVVLASPQIDNTAPNYNPILHVTTAMQSIMVPPRTWQPIFRLLHDSLFVGERAILHQTRGLHMHRYAPHLIYIPTNMCIIHLPTTPVLTAARDL